jgi:hypothetical protein
MRLSEDRILTTHTGSLPRGPEFEDLLIRKERGEQARGVACRGRPRHAPALGS